MNKKVVSLALLVGLTGTLAACQSGESPSPTTTTPAATTRPATPAATTPAKPPATSPTPTKSP